VYSLNFGHARVIFVHDTKSRKTTGESLSDPPHEMLCMQLREALPRISASALRDSLIERN
jgi:hypothetical protein